MTIYSLDVLLFLYGTSLLFHVQVYSCFLTCIQISQEAGQVVWYFHLQNFPQFIVIHTVEGFGIVNKGEIDVFLELSCFFDDPADMAIWSQVPLPFLKPAWTSASSQFMYCWSLAWRILSITLVIYFFCHFKFILFLNLKYSKHFFSLQFYGFKHMQRFLKPQTQMNSQKSNMSGSSQCTSPEHLSHASNLGWWSVWPLMIYMFWCCSLRSSHPRLLPQSPKICSVHLCLFFCFAYRVIITIFLNSIYMLACCNVLYLSSLLPSV